MIYCNLRNNIKFKSVARIFKMKICNLQNENWELAKRTRNENLSCAE